MRIAAMGDLHCRIDSAELMGKLFRNIQDDADVLILAGDLTDTGLPAEMEVLLKALESLKIPIIAVLGNHDHESDKAEELCAMMTSSGVRVLQGTVFEIDDVGFVGTKGFCGGFDNAFVQPFGERALKDFIQTSIDEAVKLENAVMKMNCDHKIAVLHYAPVKATLQGENPELYAFLGSSRLGNALDRHDVNVIFHAHAHHGSPSGQTPGRIPVFNVSRFVLGQNHERPYCLYEVGG